MPALPPDRPRCPKSPGGRRPLPDPEAIRLCRIPDPAPPYDSEAPPGPDGAASRGETRAAAAGAATGTGPGQAGSGQAGSGGAVAAAWPSRFAQVLAETLAGSRPAEQMTPWTTQMARVHIQRLGPRLASGQQPKVRRVVTFRPTADVLEMSVVVGFGPRVRALAVRMERSEERQGTGQAAGRWLCTAVEAA
jgi:hypothetical protein